MDKVSKIWMDGKMVDWDNAKVHVLSNGLHYGSGAFEGIRCYKTDKSGAVFRLDEHIDRLFYSAGCLGLKSSFSKEEIKEAVIGLIHSNGLEDCYVRPIIFSGYGGMGLDISEVPINVAIAVWPWGAYLGGKNVKAVVSKYKRLSPDSVVIDAKICGYYSSSVFASMEARKAGADEAIFLDKDGFVAEGPGENIFIVKEEKLYTPIRGSILPGITRDSVIKISADMGLETLEGKITIDELKNADEIFFTGTAVEVCPVAVIDGQTINNGNSGQITARIKGIYDKIIRGRDEKYKNWLTLVNG